MIEFEKDGFTLKPLGKESREWALFYMFAVTFLNADPIGFEEHIDWIRQRPFESPDEWLGPEGRRFRARYGLRNSSTEFLEGWRNFKRANRQKSIREINLMLDIFISGHAP